MSLRFRFKLNLLSHHKAPERVVQTSQSHEKHESLLPRTVLL